MTSGTKRSIPRKRATAVRESTADGRPAAPRATGKGSKAGTMPVTFGPFRAMLRTAPLIERVQIERHGVPYQVVQGLLEEIGVSSSDFQRYVRIPKATYIKKMKERSFFAGTPGQSVVGLLDLINRVEDMLAAERDNPEARGFDVEKWVGEWIRRPQPALGGLAPVDLLDTPSGRESVLKVLGAMQSGAYQ